MKPLVPVPAVAAGMLWLCATGSLAAATPAAKDPVLATVNGEPVPLSRLRPGGGESSPAPDDPMKLLDRLIHVELVVQEGYRMGLEETLEVRDQLGIFERDTLRDGLFASRVGAVKAGPKEVDAMARDMTTEVRLRSAVFKAKADADRLVARASGGGDFDAAAAEIAADGRGNVDPGEGFIKASELLPEVRAAVLPLSPGRVSPVYRIGAQYAVTRLVERRSAPDPDARAKAEVEVLRRAQIAAITSYVTELKTKYAKADEALVRSIDFNAERPGFDSYLADRRPLVTISGEEPITVADLADAVRKRLFHGADRAAEMGRLDRKKDEVLDDLIGKRVVMKEARARGLDKKPEYLALREEVERELVFGAFVAKVIEPEVKVTDAEIGKYYDAHRADFTAPDMARLESLAFGNRKDAEAALAKLRSGAELAWMRANAPGRLDPATHPELLRFPAAPVTLGDLPDELRKALAEAQSNEYRLYGASDGSTHVILVREVLKGRTLPLESAEGRIRAHLTAEKRQKTFDEYAAKLRKASDVKVLVTSDELKRLVAGG